MPYDPRSIANLILQEAKAREIHVTNLALQKILYFVHGKFLVEEGEPLIAGSFEAWQFGPVNIAVYDAFKASGSLPITTLASRKSLRTGEITTVDLPDDSAVRTKVLDIAIQFLKLSAGRLVDLSHARGSPWDRVTEGTNGKRIFGLKITNENILENFKYHKISIESAPRVGEPDEESSPY